MVATVIGADAAVAVAVEARHGRLGEESEGLFEDCVLGGRSVSEELIRSTGWMGGPQGVRFEGSGQRKQFEC